jgi:hypothetical protein
VNDPKVGTVEFAVTFQPVVLDGFEFSTLITIGKVADWSTPLSVMPGAAIGLGVDTVIAKVADADGTTTSAARRTSHRNLIGSPYGPATMETVTVLE